MSKKNRKVYCRKVYCAFPFFNELQLLKLKLEELWSVVDFFIISEGTLTHSSKEKPLYFEENKHLFEKYRSKIIHQIVKDTPNNPQELNTIRSENELHDKVIQSVKTAYWFDKNVSSYLRDTYEKESVIRAMANCNHQDIVILGDCDEIPNANTLKKIIGDFDNNQIYHMQHSFWWYYLNVLKTDENWFGNMVMSFEKFKNVSFCDMRNHKSGIFVDNAGWHFTYMGGAENVKRKVSSWGEQSLNVLPVTQNIDTNIKNCLVNGRDIFFRPAKFEKVEISLATHPKYLVENTNEFSNLMLI